MIKISALGHRKRIIASLAERPYEEAPTKSRRLSPIMVRLLMRKTVKPSLFPQIDWLALHQWVHTVPNVMRMMEMISRLFFLLNKRVLHWNPKCSKSSFCEEMDQDFFFFFSCGSVYLISGRDFSISLCSEQLNAQGWFPRQIKLGQKELRMSTDGGSFVSD